MNCTWNIMSNPRLHKLSKRPVPNHDPDDKLLKSAPSHTHITKIEEVPGDLLKNGFQSSSPDQDHTNNVINERIKLIQKARKAKGLTHSTKGSSLEREGDLIGMLTKQLYLAENQLKRMQSVLLKAEDRLKLKDKEVSRLKRKITEWEVKCNNQESSSKKELEEFQSQIENSEYLYKRCLLLEHRIFEMEKFLKDYGLTWVGDGNSNFKEPEALIRNYIETCYDDLIANIEQLNLAVGKDEVQVHHNQNGAGATFKTAPCLHLKFYKNGMILQNGPLRPYEQLETVSFVRDILDGYFPSELQKHYPNGVPFKVEDRRKEMFIAEGFPGNGYKLGKNALIINESKESLKKRYKKKSSSQSPKSNTSQDRMSNIWLPSFDADFPPPPGSSLSTSRSADLSSLRSQILACHNNNCSDTHLQSHINAELGFSTHKDSKELIKTKIKQSDGKASNVSSTERISRKMSLSPRCPTKTASLSGTRLGTKLSKTQKSLVEESLTSALDNIKCRASRKLHASKSATVQRKIGPSSSVQQINESTGRLGELRLKVRSLNGSTVFLVHVFPDDTVSKLYQILDTTICNVNSRRYKIVVSGYMTKRLEKLNATLQDYGITRDCVLHLIND